MALLFTEAKELALASGIMSGAAGLGGTLGPVLSGLFISVATWRWIFYVNVPVAIFSVIAVSRLVAESRVARPEGHRQGDATGAVLGTTGLSSVAARRELSRASDVRLDSLALSHDADGELLLTSPDGAAEGDRR